MTHVTLNTGHTVVQPRSKVLPGTIEAMQVLLPKGGNLGKVSPVFSAFRVDITPSVGTAAFTVYRGSELLVLNIVCWDATLSAKAWSLLESNYLKVSEKSWGVPLGQALPEQPATVPWLGTLLLPGLAMLTRDDVGWLGDFEHCLAVALSEAR